MAKQPVKSERLEVREEIGKRLRLVREWLGYPQRRFAALLGLTQLSVINYETGRTPFPTDLLPVLKQLGADSSWVATGCPCLLHSSTRKRFALVLKWVRRESAIHGFAIEIDQEVEIAWFIMMQMLPMTQSDECLPDDEVGEIVRDLIAERLG